MQGQVAESRGAEVVEVEANQVFEDRHLIEGALGQLGNGIHQAGEGLLGDEGEVGQADAVEVEPGELGNGAGVEGLQAKGVLQVAEHQHLVNGGIF